MSECVSVCVCVCVTLTHPGGSVEWAGCDSAVEGRLPPLKQKPVRMTVGRPGAFDPGPSSAFLTARQKHARLNGCYGRSTPPGSF